MRKMIVALCLGASAYASASATASPELKDDPSLLSFLRETSTSARRGEIGYAATYNDLNGDGINEALVYNSDPDSCGTGGCFFSVLQKQHGKWTLISDVGLVRPPIWILPSSHNGWRDIAVHVSGGGGRPHNQLLSFDGHSYPEDPHEEGARTIGRPVRGVMVIRDETALKPLFPQARPRPR